MIDPAELYPMKFTPIYKERIWGGHAMKEVLGRDLPATATPVGEAWEISDREDGESIVANGELAGKTLGELTKFYGRALLGRNAGNVERFPLLVKLIDAGDRLSLQVHPDAASCAALGKGEPKTEMWYIVSAMAGAKILAGLSPRTTQLQLKTLIDNPSVEKLLQSFPSMPGDAYYIPAGTLHAIGAGNLLLEIQQNSDTTYRISDWGRVGADGKARTLHLEDGLRSIDFTNRVSPRIAGTVDRAGFNRKFEVITQCSFFKVWDLRLISPWRDDTAVRGSFHLISAINAPVGIARRSDGAEKLHLAAGETALIPANLGAYVILPERSGETTVLKTTL
ncbi:MAG: class I mannose-6-phosphate isomerase [Victivallaceae bacterium]|nr:class I mannose-6-phosphate isomerase [Victivallaceae bacterium]